MDGVSGRPLNWLPSGLTALISSLERTDSLAVQLKAFSVTQAVKALLSVKEKPEKDDSWGPASSGFNRSGSLDALRELTKPLVGGAGLYGIGFHLTSSVFPCESDEFCECQGCGCGDPDCAVCEPCVSEEEFEYEEHHVFPELQYQWGLGLGSVALIGGPNPYFRSQRLASKKWPNVHNFGWAKLLETRAAFEERECAQSVSGSSGKVGEGNEVAKDDDDARGCTGVCEKSLSMGSTFNDVRRENVDAGEVPDSRGRGEGLQSSKKAEDSPQRSTEASEAVSESQRNHATTRADVKRSQDNVDNVANVASSTSLTRLSPNWWPFGAQSVVAPSIRETAKWNFRMGQNAVAGALAGGVVSLCLHPIDTLKTIVQSQTGGSRNLLPILSSVISERGLKGLYRGLGSNLASSAPTSAIYTLTYEAVKAGLLPHIPEDMSALAHCGAGACASVATSIVYTPSECVKQQMQVNGLYQNSWQTFTSLLKQGGLPMLYKGWGAVLCRNVPQSVIKFYTYEALKHWARGDQPRDTPMTTLQALAIGGVAGSTAAFFTTPFDVVKTRLQTQIPGSVQQYNGVIHAFQYIATTEGVAGLYRGLVPRLVIYVTQGALFFASYEFIKHVLAVEVPRLRIKASQIEGYQRQSAPIPAEST